MHLFRFFSYRDVQEAEKHQKDLESGAAADKKDDHSEEANIPKPKQFSPQKPAPEIKEDFSTINLSAVPGSSDILAKGGREGDSQTQTLAAPNKTTSALPAGRKQRVKFAGKKVLVKNVKTRKLKNNRTLGILLYLKIQRTERHLTRLPNSKMFLILEAASQRGNKRNQT